MKTLTRVTLLAVGLGAAALPLLTAGDAAAPAAARHPRLRALLLRRQALRQRLAHRLGLSADQVAQLKAERAKVVTAVQGIRADPGLTPEQKRAKIRETLQSARPEFRSALTPEQLEKIRDLRARFRAHD